MGKKKNFSFPVLYECEKRCSRLNIQLVCAEESCWKINLITIIQWSFYGGNFLNVMLLWTFLNWVFVIWPQSMVFRETKNGIQRKRNSDNKSTADSFRYNNCSLSFSSSFSSYAFSFLFFFFFYYFHLVFFPVANAKQCVGVFASHLHGEHCARCKFSINHNRSAQTRSGAGTCQRLSRPIFHINSTVSRQKKKYHTYQPTNQFLCHQCHKSDLHIWWLHTRVYPLCTL